MRNITGKRAINPADFANITTGEMMSDEFGNGVTSVNIKTNLLKVKSLEFFMVDSNAKKYLSRLFTDAEMGRLYKMFDMTMTEYNVLFLCDSRKPHTKQTLMEALDLGRNTFEPFFNRLIKLGVIYFIRGKESGKNKMVDRIILNPTISRKRSTFSVDCMGLFEDFSKKK